MSKLGRTINGNEADWIARDMWCRLGFGSRAKRAMSKQARRQAERECQDEFAAWDAASDEALEGADHD